MFLMMIMIHEKSFRDKPLMLRNADDLVSKALQDLPNLLDACLKE
jgi:hypothetical protein